MKIATEVSADKLRGGFYTPDYLVSHCLNRVQALLNGSLSISLLEPSMGDGAFLRSLSNHDLGSRISKFVGIEVVPAEAETARRLAAGTRFDASVRTMSAISWASETLETFDAAVGNPPFVRFQFVEQHDIGDIVRLGDRLKIAFRGVSNLWIPVLLGALSRLRHRGAMAFVVPAELFTGVSAGLARHWLLSNFERFQVDLFEPGSFPGVLQEIVVISGVRRSNTAVDSVPMDFVEHMDSGKSIAWSHTVPVGAQSWTRFLLTPTQIEALSYAMRLPGFSRLGDVARIEVSIVTGANDFFSVSSEEARRFDLVEWVEPLLPRIRLSRGLVYRESDHEETAESGAKAWLLNFAPGRSDPETRDGARTYLSKGEAEGLHSRYKTSIRSPWYRLPSVWSGGLLLSKRSHWYPRLVVNEARALTTDTIYRGNMLPIYRGQEAKLVAGFHNSVTILSTELEGRSFGGGVLELVPSEISRLAVPFCDSAGEYLAKLDGIARAAAISDESPVTLLDATDEVLMKSVPGLGLDALNPIRDAQTQLQKRRLDRN